MTYSATHTTVYNYTGAVATCQNQVRLRPRDTSNQTVHSSTMTVEPEAEVFHEFRDYFGNYVHNFSVLEEHSTLTIEAHSLVEVTALTLPDPAWTPPWEVVRNEIRACGSRDALDAFEYSGASPFVPTSGELAAFAGECFPADRPILQAAIELSARIHREFQYLPASTTIDTPIADVFRMRKGVCQDFAHLAIGAMRSLGLACRYVSGYLRSGAQFTGAEASHAWISVWAPPFGWIDLDPTNNVLPSEGHITLAWGRDYGDVTPVKGITLGGGEHRISVAVRVRPAS
jgi:transglutaminase-like putative cysteine protease